MSNIYKNREMEDVAEEWKEHLLNDPELRARQFERALPYSGRDTERLVLKARELLVEEIKGSWARSLPRRWRTPWWRSTPWSSSVARTRIRRRS